MAIEGLKDFVSSSDISWIEYYRDEDKIFKIKTKNILNLLSKTYGHNNENCIEIYNKAISQQTITLEKTVENKKYQLIIDFVFTPTIGLEMFYFATIPGTTIQYKNFCSVAINEDADQVFEEGRAFYTLIHDTPPNTFSQYVQYVYIPWAIDIANCMMVCFAYNK